MKKKTILAALSAMVATLSIGGASAFAETTVSSFSELTAAFSAGETSIKLGSDIEATAKIEIPVVQPAGRFHISGNGHKITRAAGYKGEVFHVPEEAELNISDLIFDGGAPGWVAKTDEFIERWNSDRSRLYGQYSVEIADGDMIADEPFIENDGYAQLNNITIKDTITSSNVSGIINRGTMHIGDSIFEHNYNMAKTYAAVIVNEAPGQILNILRSKFINNNSGRNVAGSWCDGAAIAIIDGGTITIGYNEFKNNSTIMNGAGIYLITANDVGIGHNLFEGNKAGNDGAAVFIGDYEASHTSEKINLLENTYKDNIGLTYGHVSGNSEGAVVSYGFNFKKISINGDKFIGNRSSFHSALALYYSEDDSPFAPRALETVELNDVLLDGNYTSTSDGGVTAAIHGIDTANINNLTYTNNQGRFTVQDVTDVNVDTVKANNNKSNTTIFHVSRVDNATIKNIEANDNVIAATTPTNFFGSITVTGIKNGNISSITAKRNKGGKGAALTVTNRAADTSKLTIKDVDIEDNESSIGGAVYINNVKPLEATFENATVINNKSLVGGGVYAEFEAQHDIAFNGGKIYGNTATESADDVAYIISAQSTETASLGQFKLPVASDMRIDGVDGWYHDAANARYSASNIVEQEGVSLASTNNYYLKAANKTGAPIANKDVDNPATGDMTSIALLMLAVSAVIVCGVVHHSAQRR